MGNSGDVLLEMRGVLTEHMDSPQTADAYRVQSSCFIGQSSGRIIAEDEVRAGHDSPGALMLTMRDGSEYRLTLEPR